MDDPYDKPQRMPAGSHMDVIWDPKALSGKGGIVLNTEFFKFTMHLGDAETVAEAILRCIRAADAKQTAEAPDFRSRLSPKD